MGKRVLVCPLDWGLGHATRCVPVIRELLKQGASPVLAGSGSSGRVLQEAFPQLPFLGLPSYGIRYPSGRMVWNMAGQMPRITRAIWKEHRQVAQWIRPYRIEAIISDHRYGCYNRYIPSVFITHQLHLIIPGAWLQRWTNRLHHHFIHRYNYCWIPDLVSEGNLGGRLSHPPLTERDRYIGHLSRLEQTESNKKYDILLLLSGPEPQRTRLERRLCEQARLLDLNVLLVRGVTEEENKRWKTGSLEIVNYLPAGDLSRAVAASELIICRPGYSTLMDLLALGKKALLIPTPGQTEQEYLAQHLFEQKICLFSEQRKLHLKEAVEAGAAFPGFQSKPSDGEALREAVAALLRTL